jgi:hypothetical protein
MAVSSSPTLLAWLTAALYGPPIGLSGDNDLVVVRLTSLKALTLNFSSFSVLGLSLHDVVVHI